MNIFISELNVDVPLNPHEMSWFEGVGWYDIIRENYHICDTARPSDKHNFYSISIKFFLFNVYSSICIFFLIYFYAFFCCCFIFILFYFFRPCHEACEILVPLPGIKPVSPALGVWSLNHWMTREVSPDFLYPYFYQSPFLHWNTPHISKQKSQLPPCLYQPFLTLLNLVLGD